MDAPGTSDTASNSLTDGSSLRARLRALESYDLLSVLDYLTGYAPHAVRAALDEIESQNATNERLGYSSSGSGSAT